MLAFLTLLLGIVTGPREIELVAPPGAARVEVFLDGERVAQATRPPWTFDVDFGACPRPHHLDAAAFDAKGKEIARVRQRVNFPRPEAEAVLALLPGKGGKDRIARLAWEGAVGVRPVKVAVTFDGKPLDAPDPARIPLPHFVPERLHFLRATLDFERGAHVETEITIGGKDRDEASRSLTAVPLRVPRGTAAKPEAMDGWLSAGGETLRVAAVESGDASIVVVLDREVTFELREIRDWGGVFPTRAGVFHGEPEIRTLLPYADEASGAQAEYDVFPRSYPAHLRNGLLHTLAEVYPPADPSVCPRVPDAVAAAGLVAAAWSHPRAVVLVLSGDPDRSLLTVAEARAYLADLAVPLVVWTGPSTDPAAAAPWGGGRTVRTRAEFRKAVQELDEEVRSQPLVWVEGTHLPQDVALGPAAPRGVSLAR